MFKSKDVKNSEQKVEVINEHGVVEKTGTDKDRVKPVNPLNPANPVNPVNPLDPLNPQNPGHGSSEVYRDPAIDRTHKNPATERDRNNNTER